MSRSHEKLGLMMATIIGMNAMIGAGIFAVPAALQTSVGPAGILTYALVIVGVICMALTFARVAQEFSQEGSFYTYAYQWGGHTAGVLATTSYLIGLIIAMSLLTRITGSSLHVYIPHYSAEFLGLCALTLMTLLNLAGAVLSKAGQIILLVLTILPIVGITGLCLLNTQISNLIPFAPYGFSQVFTATKAVVFGFFGFEAIPSLFSIVENPKRNVPLAIIYSVALVGTIYLIFVTAIMVALPRSLFIDAGTPLSQVLVEFFPTMPWLIHSINWAIIITIMGTIHAMIWAVSSLMSSFSKKLSSTHLTHKQAVLILGTSIGVCSLVLKSINLLFSLAAIFIILAYTTTLITFIYSKKNKSCSSTIIAWVGIITALIICACAFDGVWQELF